MNQNIHLPPLCPCAPQSGWELFPELQKGLSPALGGFLCLQGTARTGGTAGPCPCLLCVCSWALSLDFISQAHSELLHVYEKQTMGLCACQGHESRQGSENNKILFNILQETQQMFNFLSIKMTPYHFMNFRDALVSSPEGRRKCSYCTQN